MVPKSQPTGSVVSDRRCIDLRRVIGRQDHCLRILHGQCCAASGSELIPPRCGLTSVRPSSLQDGPPDVQDPPVNSLPMLTWSRDKSFVTGLPRRDRNSHDNPRGVLCTYGFGRSLHTCACRKAVVNKDDVAML